MINFPTESEKEQSINQILDYYEQVKFKYKLFKPFKELPYSIIFQSSLIVKVLSFISILIYFYIIGNIHQFYLNPTDKDLSAILLFFAPILYLIHLIDTSKAFSNQMFELECTLKYQFHQIIGYKFIVLTLISIVMNGVLLVIYPNLNMIEISITVLVSIFIMTSFIYYIVFKFKNPILPFVLIIMWAGLNLGLISIIPDHIFHTIKTLIYTVGTLIGIVLHIFQFHFIFHKTKDLGGHYA